MKCRICGEKCKNHSPGRDVWKNNNEYHDYALCEGCGCVQIKKYPDDMSSYYESDYYSFNVDSDPSALKRFFVNLRDRYAIYGTGLIGRILFHYYPTKQFSCVSYPKLDPQSKILDVGCGDGSLLKGLSRNGFSRLLGIDPFLTHEQTISQPELLKKDIWNIDQLFDVVIMKGTLEHQKDQISLLMQTHKLLVEEGRCIIRIPIADSAAFKEYDSNWVQYDGPRHFYLHTRKSLSIAAHAAGFYVHDFWDDSEFLQIVGSEQLKRGMALGEPDSIVRGKKSKFFSKEELKSFKEKNDRIVEGKMGDTYIFELRKFR